MKRRTRLVWTGREMRLALVVGCFLAFNCTGAVRPIVFGPPAHYSTSTQVNLLCSGDFNGDRRLDLAASGILLTHF